MKLKDMRNRQPAPSPVAPSPAGPAPQATSGVAEATFRVAPASEPPAQSPAGLPPARPCRALDASLDVCGCPSYWIDAYGRLHCWACEPPGAPAMVRLRMRVVSLPAGLTWEVQQPGGDWRRKRAPGDADADEWDVHELPDGRLIIQRRGVRLAIPITQSIDDWWQEQGDREAAARRTIEFDRSRRAAAGEFSGAEKNAQPAQKKAGEKKRAEKKPAAGELAGFEK